MPDLAQKLIPVHNLHILVGKIKGDLDHGPHLEEFIPDGIDTAEERPCQLLLGQVHPLSGLGRQDINNRLGLGQVDAAIEKCALGKFPGMGQDCAQGENQLKDVLEDEKTAMAVDFDHVLPGVCPGGTHINSQHLIQNLTIRRTYYPSIIEVMSRKGTRGTARSEEFL